MTVFLSVARSEEKGAKVKGLLRLVREKVKQDLVLGDSSPFSSYSNDFTRLKDDGTIHTYVHVQVADGATTQKLKDLGCRVELVSTKYKIVQCWAPLDKLDAISDLTEVVRITVPSYGVTRAGSVSTEGDAIHRADDVRNLGHNGSGVKVGIISDGVDSLQTAVNSGDLPNNVEVIPGKAGSGDEGTAMLEIVHDLAPGASLAFATAKPTSLDMIDAINMLVAADCDVICDDVGYRFEPFFEDGPLAQAAQAAVDGGAFYCSAAGNDAGIHYEADFSDLGQRTHSGQTFDHVHDFGGGDFLGDIPLFAGWDITIVFQWANEFGGATDEYDMHLTNGSNVLATSFRVFGNSDPVEVLSYTPTANANGNILINRSSGSGVRLEFFIHDGGERPGWSSLFEHVVRAGSIWGHPAAPGVFGTGAIDANDPGKNDVEIFSSQGPSRIFFPAQVARNKPEACGIDGVSVTGVGGFGSPFFGTSAAAPHIAGVAALLLSARPGATAAQLRDVLQRGAVDIEAAGYDLVAGSGRVDAYQALALLAPRIQGVSISPERVLGGGAVTGTVTLENPVMLGNVTVTLRSSNSDAASTPPSVTITAPDRSATFQVQTSAVAFPERVTVSATSEGVTASGDLVVRIEGATGGGGGGGGCFVATAAYGTRMHPSIGSLSEFRDKKLRPTAIGEAFTQTYYSNSPRPADILGGSELLRTIARRLIRPAVNSVEAVRTLRAK